jgi:hypothetical protein
MQAPIKDNTPLLCKFSRQTPKKNAQGIEKFTSFGRAINNPKKQAS